MNYGSKVKEFYDQLIDEMRENYERKKRLANLTRSLEIQELKSKVK